MKRAILAVLAAGLATTWVGCQQATDSSNAPSANQPASEPASQAGGEQASQAGGEQAAATAVTFVSLKVPNMT